MTDRIKGYIVTLEKDLRTDDAEPIINAITQLRGVLSVNPVKADSLDFIVEERVRQDLGQKLWEVLKRKT